MTLVPQTLQIWISGSIIAIAILVGTLQALIEGHIAGPFAAIVLFVLISPSMLRGARSGSMRPHVAWTLCAAGIAIPILATLQLDPDEATYLSVSWFTCGVLASWMLLWMAQQRVPVAIALVALVTQTMIWAGPVGVVRIGLAAEVLLLGATLLVYRTIRVVAATADAANARERQLSFWQAEQDAFHAERRRRLQDARIAAFPLLQHIIDTGCDLDERTTAECRTLEQTIRDEIRGRRLLNDAMRSAVLAHRQRGASVHILDDGGLDDLEPALVEAMLEELVGQLRPLRSQKIIVRTANPDSATAVTLVATSPGPLGDELEMEEVVDLFSSIPRPDLGPRRTTSTGW